MVREKFVPSPQSRRQVYAYGCDKVRQICHIQKSDENHKSLKEIGTKAFIPYKEFMRH